MNRINVLDENTSNKIAAGEVVERPSSVVKELIENSIDAGAKNINIEIEESGQKSIKVIDDGKGIHPEDLKKAFLPHATSKIKLIDDIFTLNTMGFRGEALASIGAVSKTKLISRTEEFSSGKELLIQGGTMDCMKDAGANIGTSITVENLFYNVPARLKFLKSTKSEASSISDIISRISIANPNVAFKPIVNGKPGNFTSGNGDMFDAIRSIYGKNISENITYFERCTDIAMIYGYIGNSEISRGSRTNQSIFINKRYIKSKMITAAVENAFKSFLTINKFPFFVLFIDIYPELIDVNVHPTKSEVKFEDDRAVFKLVFDTVHEALRKKMMSSMAMEEYTAKPNNPVDNQSIETSFNYKEKNNDEIHEKPMNVSYEEKINEDIKSKTIQIPIDLKPIKIENERTPKFSKVRIIGQFHSTYILGEQEDELVLIDQHAAHEKILFEKYKKSIEEREIISQVLLTPMVMELSSNDFCIYTENTELFKTTGFDIEIFGENTVSIREVPMILGKPDIKNLFMDIIDNIKNMGTGTTVEVKYDRIAKLSCKAAVKGNNVLSMAEMESLVEELRFINEPFTCPHGRPTVIKFSVFELEKKFKRIQ